MGSSFTARCKNCDLRASGLIGGGLTDFQTFAAWPCLCRSCGDITTANTLAESLTCIGCDSSKVTLYDDTLSLNDGPLDRPGSDIRWMKMGLDTSRAYLCPRCGSYAVEFQAGSRNWD